MLPLLDKSMLPFLEWKPLLVEICVTEDAESMFTSSLALEVRSPSTAERERERERVGLRMGREGKTSMAGSLVELMVVVDGGVDG